MKCRECGLDHASGANSASPCAATIDAPPPMPSPDDFVGRMIPSGNKPALIAYYAGILALIPVVGLAFAIVAVIYGVRGVSLERRHPEVRGGLHAWFGILVGGFFGLVWLAAAVFLVVLVAKA